MNNMQKYTLENGLTVFYFPKKDFSKTYAILATNYGAVDSIFETEEGFFETPQGVAHFLEHKLFEQKDGTNALQLFAKTGASPNAFTSQTMTAYYFECTSDFEENYKILLDYVSNPYFTKENVDKEQGIIGQEIKMVEDSPNWVAFVNLFGCLYHSHPIKESIIGSIESIAKIDAPMLYHCHKVFYNANNMALCIAGDIDIESALKTAEMMYPKPQATLKSRDYKNEISTVAHNEICVNMEVSLPIFMIGYKDISKIENQYKREIIANIAGSYLCGKSSELYSRLYNDGLVDRSFDAEYTKFPQGGAFIIAGQSKNPELVREIVQNHFENFEVDAEKLSSIIKSYTGQKVRALDSFDDLCIGQIDAYFAGANFSDFEQILKNIKPRDIKDFISSILNHSGISMVKPN